MTENPVITRDETIVAGFVAPEMLQALRFPRGATDFGTAEELLNSVAQVISDRFGLDAANATLCAMWARSTWFADLFDSPTTLIVLCDELSHCISFLRFLRCITRRAMLLGNITRNLPFSLHPTLLVCDPALSAKEQSWWHSTNDRGLLVSTSGGGLSNYACAKAIALPDHGAPDAFGKDALRLWLPPCQGSCAVLSTSEEKILSDRFLPQFLMLRLRNYTLINPFASENIPAALRNSRLAQQLLACGRQEAKLSKLIAPALLTAQDDEYERLAVNEQAVIVECLWDSAMTRSQSVWRT